jgi:SSS family solute:Na+ symporter
VGLYHVGPLYYLLFLLGAQRVLYGKDLFRLRIAGRSIPFFAFLLAATAASFSGWTFIGHPGLIWRDGLAYAFASFYVLTIPITGTFFSKRTWLLGKRYGFITPGDMYAYYFNSEPLRWLVVLTAVLYSMFYSAVQLMASAALFNVIAGVPVTFGAIFMAFIVWFYVCTGGLKASTWVGVIQFVLLVGGIVILGLFVVTSEQFGGWRVSPHRFTHWMPSSWKFPG